MVHLRLSRTARTLPSEGLVMVELYEQKHTPVPRPAHRGWSLDEMQSEGSKPYSMEVLSIRWYTAGSRAVSIDVGTRDSAARPYNR